MARVWSQKQQLTSRLQIPMACVAMAGFLFVLDIVSTIAMDTTGEREKDQLLEARVAILFVTVNTSANTAFIVSRKFKKQSRICPRQGYYEEGVNEMDT